MHLWEELKGLRVIVDGIPEQMATEVQLRLSIYKEENESLRKRAETAEVMCSTLREALNNVVKHDGNLCGDGPFGPVCVRLTGEHCSHCRAVALLAQPNLGDDLLEELKRLRVLVEDVPELTDKEVQEMSASYKEEIAALKEENKALRQRAEYAEDAERQLRHSIRTSY